MVTVPDTSALAEIALFQKLTPTELTRLRSLLHGMTCPAGTKIMTFEQPGEVAYIVLQGTLKIHVEQASGADVILAIQGAGEVVGEMSLVGSPGRSATVVTMEETSLPWIDRAAFWDCLQSMPVMAGNLIGIMARRLRLANEQIQALATLDVYGRVARQLLAFAQAYGVVGADGGTLIPLRLTQSDLADLVGASRVRVNQVLVAFRQRGCIVLDQQSRILVRQPVQLAEYCA
jgi:CRP/FNR family cyclic AMP-dependent transcriptional regulator